MQTSENVSPILQVRNLSKRFQIGGETRTVLDDVSFDLFPGHLVALVGRSGSGKSTLLNTLGTLLSIEEGTVEIGETSIAHLTSPERAKFRAENIGFVFQSFHLITTKTVLENVRLPLSILGKTRKQADALASSSLTAVGLDSHIGALPTTLSGGEQQRAAIARALSVEPRLLLCDEPTGNLDSNRADEVFRLLRQVTTSDRCTIIVTHDRDLAAKCDVVLSITDGKVTESASTSNTPLKSASGPPEGPRPGKSNSSALGSSIREFWRLALSEAGSSLMSRGFRNFLTALGMVLGIAVLVTTSGLSTTAAAQISDKFNSFLAQQLSVSHSGKLDDATTSTLFLENKTEGVEAVRQLNGVRSAGIVANVPLSGDLEITGFNSTRSNGSPNSSQPAYTVRLLTATPEALPILGAKLKSGRFYDAGHQNRGDAVAIVGAGVMKAYGLTFRPGVQVFLGTDPYTIVGVVDDRTAAGSLLNSVIIPLNSKFNGQHPATEEAKLLVQIQPGAAEQVGREAKRVFDPTRPDLVSVGFPLEPTTLRNSIDEQTTLVMYIMSAVILAIGGIGIMNTYLVSVIERRREIGLRLALGTRPGGILTQLALESLLLGALGAVVGVLLGIVVVVGISVANGWAPIIDPVVPPRLGS